MYASKWEAIVCIALFFIMISNYGGRATEYFKDSDPLKSLACGVMHQGLTCKQYSYFY